MATNNSSDYSPAQYNVQTGGALGTLNNVAPSVTSGIPVISQGSSSQPIFGTAVVAGGGTGDTSFTAYAPVCGGTSTTGALQSASTGISTSGFVLTSNGASSLASFKAVSASGAVTTIDGDTGSAVPNSGVLTIYANNASQNCGSSVLFSNSSSTSTLNVTDSLQNTLIGANSGNSTLTGAANCGLASAALSSLTSGHSNTAIGWSSGISITTGIFNVSLGDTSFYNPAAACTGSYNLILGSGTGTNYTTSESSNILLNHAGVVAESNVLRIGNGTGTSTKQLNNAFISGINGNTSTSPAVVTINTSTDQLGTATFTLAGSWAPVLAFGGASSGITYSAHTGEYSQIGNVVVFALHISLTNVGTSTGNATITLPVNNAGSTLSVVNCSVVSNVTLGALNTLMGGYIQGNVINITQSGSAQAFSALTNTAFANNSELYITGTYFTS
jgi:hypothetical protein